MVQSQCGLQDSSGNSYRAWTLILFHIYVNILHKNKQSMAYLLEDGNECSSIAHLWCTKHTNITRENSRSCLEFLYYAIDITNTEIIFHYISSLNLSPEIIGLYKIQYLVMKNTAHWAWWPMPVNPSHSGGTGRKVVCLCQLQCFCQNSEEQLILEAGYILT
jgi:hypothetical protein